MSSDYKLVCIELIEALELADWPRKNKQKIESALERAHTLLRSEQADQRSAPPPNMLRPGDVWEFEYEVRIKGRKKPAVKLFQWEVKSWSNAEMAWHLQSLDGDHHTWLMTHEPSYSADLMRRISWGGVRDEEVEQMLKEQGVA